MSPPPATQRPGARCPVSTLSATRSSVPPPSSGPVGAAPPTVLRCPPAERAPPASERSRRQHGLWPSPVDIPVECCHAGHPCYGAGQVPRASQSLALGWGSTHRVECPEASDPRGHAAGLRAACASWATPPSGADDSPRHHQRLSTTACSQLRRVSIRVPALPARPLLRLRRVVSVASRADQIPGHRRSIRRSATPASKPSSSPSTAAAATLTAHRSPPCTPAPWRAAPAACAAVPHAAAASASARSSPPSSSYHPPVDHRLYVLPVRARDYSPQLVTTVQRVVGYRALCCCGWRSEVCATVASARSAAATHSSAAPSQ